jgi:hypothetical protein
VFRTGVEIRELCGSLGGCDYEATLSSEREQWVWVYDWASYPVLQPDARAPSTLGPGRYRLSLVVWLVSDVCDPAGCPRLRPAVDCEATLDVRPGDVEVEAIGRTDASMCSLAVQSGQPSSACRADDLEATIARIEGAAGNRFATVLVTNQGSRACELAGPISLQLTAGDDDDPPAHPWTSASRVHLEPGAVAGLGVRTANWGEVAMSPPIGLAIVLPALGGRVEAAPPPGANGLELLAPIVDPTDPQVLEVVRGWELG